MTTALMAFTNTEVWKMAVQVAESRLFGMKTPAEAFSLMLIAQAEGLHPALAARDYHIIQGRPAMKADAMLSRFQQAGGTVEWITYEDKEVAGKFTHAAGGTVTIIWTWEMASGVRSWNKKKNEWEGLTDKQVWKNYPRAMLRARCISEGIRTVYPGCVVGVYTPEEIEEDEPETVKQADIISRPAADNGNGQRDEPPGFEQAAPPSGDLQPAPADVELTCGFLGKKGEKQTAIRKPVGAMSPRALQFARTLAERNLNDRARTTYADFDKAALMRIDLEIAQRAAAEQAAPDGEAGEVSEPQPDAESPADAKPGPTFYERFGVLLLEADVRLENVATAFECSIDTVKARLDAGTPFTLEECSKLEAIGMVVSSLMPAAAS